MKKESLFLGSILCGAVLLLQGCDKLIPNGASDVKNDKVLTSESPLTSEQIKQLLGEALSELDKKNYGRSVELTIRVTKADPGNTESYVIESQAKSMSGDVQSAVDSLEKAFKNGLKDIDRLMKEQRLDPVRATPGFQELLSKYGFTSPATVTATEVKAGNVSIKEENGEQVIKAGDVVVRMPKD